MSFTEQKNRPGSEGKNVLWIAPPTSYGSYSMNHYHRELLAGKEELSSLEGWRLKSLKPPVDGAPKREGRFRRGYDRFLRIPRQVKNAGKFDIYHGLAHDAGILFRFLPKSCIRIATVHDLIPAGEFGGLSAFQKDRFRRQIATLADFDALFCVSHYTAGKIKEAIEIADEKVVVIPNGVDFDRFHIGNSKKDQCGSPFVLSVSSNHRRKNLNLLPRLFERLEQVRPGIRLIRVGGSFPEQLRKEWDEVVGSERLEEISYCSDARLAQLYREAKAFIFPSFEEGFGLPVLEAMAAGCPVACSNTSSLPEIGGDIPFLFNPNNPEEAAEALDLAISNKNNEDYLNIGFERASSFSWTRCVSQIFEQYELLQGRKQKKI